MLCARVCENVPGAQSLPAEKNINLVNADSKPLAWKIDLAALKQFPEVFGIEPVEGVLEVNGVS